MTLKKSNKKREGGVGGRFAGQVCLNGLLQYQRGTQVCPIIRLCEESLKVLKVSHGVTGHPITVLQLQEYGM